MATRQPLRQPRAQQQRKEKALAQVKSVTIFHERQMLQGTVEQQDVMLVSIGHACGGC